jgi:glyoxylase-like metal-dependent hydrolase (beta-lactamase superfamily II)
MAVIKRFSYKDIDAIRVGRLNQGINTSFILYHLDNTLIDTGPSNQWKYVKPFVEDKTISQILLTHHHEDHSGNAASIAKLKNVTPTSPALTHDIMKRGFNIPFYQHLLWGKAHKVQTQIHGDAIELGNGETLTPIHTPGHAPDLTCYLLNERGWLFSGDLYIANHLKFLRKDEDIPQLMESTRKALSYDFDTIICPHRGVVEQGKQALQEKYDNIAALCEKSQQLKAAGHSVVEISDKLLGKETFFSYISGFKFSKRNLIRSCLKFNPSHRQD